MKKIFTLLLIVGLVLGLAAPAWAASIANINVTPGYTVTSGEQITITGTIIPTADDDTTTYTYRLTRDKTITVGVGINLDFTITTNASNLKNNALQLELFETATNKQNPSAYQEYLVDETTLSFTVVSKPTMGENNLTITCNGGHSVTQATLSGSTFTFDLPAACTKGSHTLNINTAGIANVGSVDISPSSTINAATITGNNNTVITLTNIAGSSRYNLKVSLPSNEATLSKLELKNGSTSVATDNNPSTSGTKNLGSVDNSVSSVTFTPTVSSGATYKVYNALNGGGSSVSSLSLAAGTQQSFSVVVTAADGVSNKTYNYTVTRTSTSANNSLSSLQIKSGSTVLATASKYPTTSGTAEALSVGSSYSSVTIAATKADSTASVVVYSGHSSGSQISGSVSLTAGSAYQFRVEVTAQNGTKATYYYTVTRDANNNLLKSVTFKYGTAANSAVLGSLGTINGGTATSISQNLTLTTSYTSANVSWELADGASLTSAKWNGAAKTVSSNSISGSVDLPSSGSRALELKVKASSGTTYTVTINVSKSGTSTGTLSGLYVKNDAVSNTSDKYLFELSPKFSSSSSTRSYTVYANSDTDYIYIYPTLTDSNASIAISGSYKSRTDRFSSEGYYEVRLNSGSDNKVYLDVTPSGGGSYTRYTLTIDREDEVDTNASLDSLYISKSSTSITTSNRYDMTPSFSSTKLNYDVDLAKSVSEVYIHAKPYRSSATITPSGATEVSDGVYKATITSGKTKTITLTVKYSSSVNAKYTINLNSGGSSNTKARLSRIRVASRESNTNTYQYTMLPGFDAALTDYVVLVPYDSSTTYAYVQGTLNDKNDYLLIDGDEAEDGEWVEISLKAGTTKSIEVEVEDEDGNTTTYDLTFVPAPRDADDDASLYSLSLRTGSASNTAVSLSPSFSSKTTSYTAEKVANSVTSLRVYAEGENSSAILVNDTPLTDSYVDIDLNEGKTEIKVTVYAEDCETSKSYTIEVTRGAVGGRDSSLAGLELRTGSAANQTINLIPGFAKNIVSYKANVGDDTTQVSFRPTSTDNDAVIKLLGITLTSGQWTNYNAISNGSNTFIFMVTSGDGTSTSLYTVEVVRGLSVVVSGQGLNINGISVTCAAYNINGNNYFKLRDIAYALRGTTKNFNVTYNSATRIITMTSGRDYSIIGGEMTRPGAPKKYQLSSQSVILDGRTVNLTAYNVDGNNYFMLREIGALFNFGVTYNASTSTMSVNTSVAYTPE